MPVNSDFHLFALRNYLILWLVQILPVLNWVPVLLLCHHCLPKALLNRCILTAANNSALTIPA